MNEGSTGNNNWRKNAVECALNYANHLWTPAYSNSYHGYDKDGTPVNTPDSRDNGISRNCIGVDCSGLVTRCWGLTERLFTRTILLKQMQRL